MRFHEIDLLISSAQAALAGPAAHQDVARLCQLADWRSVRQLTQRHEMVPLVYPYWRRHCAGSIPAEVMAQLRLEAGVARMRAKEVTAVMLEALDAFRAGGVRAVPFKGVVLAEQAFGSAALRYCEDIDIIVPRDDVPRADGIMQFLGYQAHTPLPGPARRAEFLASEYHITYGHPDGRPAVEIHWKFGYDVLSASLDVGQLLARARPYHFGGVEISAFTVEDLLVILCLHGAKHGWVCLKWVFDVAGLLCRHPGLDLDAVDRLARASGCRKMVALGLDLAAGRYPAALREQWAMGEASTISLVGVQVRTRDTWLERWRIARPFQPGARDRAVAPLPRWLHWMYYVIRPFRLLVEYARKI